MPDSLLQPIGILVITHGGVCKSLITQDDDMPRRSFPSRRIAVIPSEARDLLANRQPLTANRQPLTADRRPPTANRQPLTANRQPPTANR